MEQMFMSYYVGRNKRSRNLIMLGVSLKILHILMGSFVISNQVFVGVLESATLGLFQKTHSSLSTSYTYTPDLNKEKSH